MDRVEAAQTRLRDVVRFASEVDGAGPPCRQCHYWRADGKCGDIANAEQSHDPVTGQYSERYNVPLAQARSKEGLCGPEAILFAPRRGWALVEDGLEKAWNGWRDLLGFALLGMMLFLILFR